jgi:hypothetical protein
MAKITYASLKLKQNDEIKKFQLADGREIEINQFLSTNDKIDLIDITLQKSREGNLYNPLLVNAYFHLHLIYLYTNITFTDKQKEDELKLYDCLDNAGIIDKVVENLPDKEYTNLLNKIDEKIQMELTYNTTAAALVSKLITDLPEQAAAAAKIVDNFDPKKYQAVIDFATAANGGRNIKTNEE